jgi:hypothetical protein
MAASGGTAADIDVDGKMRSRATEIMDQALELAAEERLSISSGTDDDDDDDDYASTTKPNTTQRQQLQNAKFNDLYVCS